ncbi:MAG TPA: TonB-dependent siderophore receptor [Terriglobia bacterium]|nr:TonB-dependent siderophore receptor [Terriglobia bacterium]
MSYQAFGEIPHTLLQGRVVDCTRAPIEGAQITAVPNGQASVFSTVSNQEGEFLLSLEPGGYTLNVAADGFKRVSQSLNLGQSGLNVPEIVLQISPHLDTVTVSESGYQVTAISSGTKAMTPLRDIPQSITVVTQDLIKDQQMTSIGDILRYVPGITVHQGENNRDQVVIRGNSSSADFFVNGVRDDVQYYRDFYNLDRVEALKGPNAMIFGRGGGGGVINRVTKEAIFTPLHEIALQGGTYGNKRVAMDFDQPVNEKVALRFNGMYEDSDSFRDYVNLQRYGINPTLTVMPSQETKITFGYEYFRDHRVADRGIPSFQGRPADTPISTFFGNPDDSHVRAKVNLGSAAIEHQAGRLEIHNRTMLGDYDRGYQNYVPGEVTKDKTQVALSAYNNATDRLNVFNQTDLTYTMLTGRIQHRLLAGTEFGRQLTDNFRNTGFFNNSTTSILAPYADPTISIPVTFRQSVTDADNHLRTNLGASYVQDQIELSRHLQVTAGLRFDYFDLQYLNNRTSTELGRIDRLLSPRAGIVFKPVAPLSVYGSYSVSYLPSSGDQFSSLTIITQQLKPEKFSNYEFGAKWDIDRYLSLTTAVYRLDRTNTRATDPNDPTRIVQTGSQRSNGFEIGVNGGITRAWRIAGGYAYQDAYITSSTAAGQAGAHVAMVPHHSLSLWNNYQIFRKLGAGLGILNRTDMFAAIDNTVTLPGYTRADGAVFFTMSERIRFQANVENLFNKRYYLNADGNNNISPGFSRALRIGLTARF